MKNSSKKKLWITLSAVLLLAATVSVSAFLLLRFDESKADKSLPNFQTALIGPENANAEGWYLVFYDEFEGTSLNDPAGIVKHSGVPDEIWTTSPHTYRTQSVKAGDTEGAYTSWWCPSMVTLNGGFVEIRSEQSSAENPHICGCCQGICPEIGRFTGGIETRRLVGGSTTTTGQSDELLFGQAFGYFEARVKFPAGNGIWSAFWLQSSNMRKLGNKGRDGTEIDVYESAFVKKPSVMGHALLWDGYGTSKSRVKDAKIDTGKDLYGGFHTFALKWTPDYYVFYIDGKPTWATNAGGVSRVKEFLRLTVELSAGSDIGPHGQTIGQFDGSAGIFYVDYVKVYQNVGYAAYEKPDSYFKGSF